MRRTWWTIAGLMTILVALQFLLAYLPAHSQDMPDAFLPGGAADPAPTPTVIPSPIDGPKRPRSTIPSFKNVIDPNKEIANIPSKCGAAMEIRTIEGDLVDTLTVETTSAPANAEYNCVALWRPAGNIADNVYHIYEDGRNTRRKIVILRK